MRKLGYVLLLFAFMCLVLSGCQNGKQADETPQPGEKAESRLIEAVEGESIDTGGMTKLDEFSFDLDLDNAEEKVELYTAAQRNEKGEMVWDDGQNWLLIVWDGEKAYPLLSQYVQLGSIYFTVSNNAEGGIPSITTIIPTGSSFGIKTYAFNKDKGGFIEETAYASKDNNFVHTSIPGY